MWICWVVLPLIGWCCHWDLQGIAIDVQWMLLSWGFTGCCCHWCSVGGVVIGIYQLVTYSLCVVMWIYWVMLYSPCVVMSIYWVVLLYSLFVAPENAWWVLSWGFSGYLSWRSFGCYCRRQSTSKATLFVCSGRRSMWRWWSTSLTSTSWSTVVVKPLPTTGSWRSLKKVGHVREDAYSGMQHAMFELFSIFFSTLSRTKFWDWN